MHHAIHIGDVREVLATLDAQSFDAVLCDPPYELTSGKNSRTGFMGQAWDGSGVAFDPATWRAVLRCLRPGAHLLAAGGTRTYHRTTCAIEDAGFEIRDCIGYAWVYGSGFPKSLNLDGSHAGYGTALKPAFEPWTLARKPLDGTVARNVQAHGCGALAIDAGRVATDEDLNGGTYSGHDKRCDSRPDSAPGAKPLQRLANGCGSTFVQPLGRWPANAIFDEAAGAELDAQSGILSTHQGSVVPTNAAIGFMGGGSGSAREIASSRGGASRFFYCAKTSTRERNAGLEDDAKNPHPTLKPITLTTYLARLMLPPAIGRPRRILVPFSGAGSEMIGCLLAGWDEVVGVELSAEYAAIAEKRIAHHLAGQMELAAE